MDHHRLNPRCVLCCLLLACLATACTRQKPTPRVAQGTTIGGEVKLLIVDDPPLAAAIAQLRGDWKARTGATIAILERSSAELAAAASLDSCDVIIYPSDLLGELAERGLIAPLPASYASNEDLAWSDTFELLQVADTQWNRVPYAVPFGSPLLTCYYRADLLERFGRKPPRTWNEYQQLAEFFARRENLQDAAPLAEVPWSGTIEPLADGWAGRVLLARAASYAKHRDQFSTLFNVDSMDPLIAGPPFVRALEELVAAARCSPRDVLHLDPAAARREFLAGHAALALSFPSHATSTASPNAATDKPLPIGFAELPGSPQVFNSGAARWETRRAEEDPHVPLLGFAGRMGSIAARAAHPEAAFQLLCWLDGQEWGAKVSSASAATTLYRRSQLSDPRPWLDPLIDSDAARQYARVVNSTLSRQTYLLAVRLPGQASYLAALDAAVNAAVEGRQTPTEALTVAAAQWRRITAEQGLDSQRAAYRKSLGLEP
jgi:multiple sugar transport system substrate-binding protein